MRPPFFSIAGVDDFVAVGIAKGQECLSLTSATVTLEGVRSDP